MTLGAIALAAVASAVAIGVATGGHDLPSAPADATWTTIFKSPAAIEGLTGDDAGRLYVAGRAATEQFRIPPPANAVGVVRVNSTLQPPLAASAQNIVANGLAFTKDGSLLIADTARGALWQVDLAKDGSVETPTGCDPTYTA